MPNDDGRLYTGIDGIPGEGMFGNEGKEKSVADTAREQKRLAQELTPKLRDILKMIDAEIDSVNSIKRFRNAASQTTEFITAELQAAALYEDYLQGFKTKFTLVLAEAKKVKK